MLYREIILKNMQCIINQGLESRVQGLGLGFRAIIFKKILFFIIFFCKIKSKSSLHKINLGHD